MILLAMQFDASLNSGQTGPATDLLQQAAQPLLFEIPGKPGSLRPVCSSPGLTAGWVDRGGFASGKPVVHISSRDNGLPKIIVLLDGYLTSAPAPLGPRVTHAGLIAELYQSGGVAALDNLDGSFNFVLLDFGPETPTHAAGVKVVVQTDPADERPICVAWQEGTSGQLLIGPEPKCFWKANHLRGSLIPAAVLSQIFNSYLFDEMTYWANVRLLGPARRLEAQQGQVNLRRYWAPTFNHASARPPSLDEYREVLKRCIADHAQHFERPVIGLSGGVDSRVLLAGARETGKTFGLVTWTYESAAQPSADFATASALVEKLTPTPAHLRWHLDNNKLAEQAERIVFINDGLIGYLGAYGDREPLAAELAKQYDAILIGDQCYRGEDLVQTTDAALDAIGVSPMNWKQTLMARFLLQPDFAAQAIRDYRERMHTLLDSAEPDQHPHPQDLHDRLYWQVRVPRILTSPKSLYRLYLEASSPMLAKPMIELSTRLTIPQRVDKQMLREATRTFASDLMAVPYAKTHSRVKWRQVFKETGPLQEKLVELLLEKDSPAWNCLNRAAVERLAHGCLVQAAQRPLEEQGGLFLPFQARFLKPFARAPLFLNLITLNLWFRHFGK